MALGQKDRKKDEEKSGSSAYAYITIALDMEPTYPIWFIFAFGPSTLGSSMPKKEELHSIIRLLKKGLLLSSCHRPLKCRRKKFE